MTDSVACVGANGVWMARVNASVTTTVHNVATVASWPPSSQIFPTLPLPPLVAPLPAWRGAYSLSAPSSPYIVTYGGSPAGCIVDLYVEPLGYYVMSTNADPITGAFSFTGLTNALTFTVRARGHSFPAVQNDQILAGLTPG